MEKMPSRASEARRRRSRPARAGRLALVLAAAAALGLFALGCAGSSGEGVAQVGSTETTTTGSEPRSAGGSRSETVAAYSACMRRNGVSNYPDPDSGGHVRIEKEPGLDPNSPQFKAAEQACKKLLPNGGQPTPQELAREMEEALRYSACMRSHGVPNFPDPRASSDGTTLTIGPIEQRAANSPQFKAATQACEELLPHGAAGGGR